MKRVFMIVLDSLGVGAAPDAQNFGDPKFCNTLGSILSSGSYNLPNLQKLGLFNLIEKESKKNELESEVIGAFGRLCEKSAGKDTTVGHWELCGVISDLPMPTYPEGFPEPLICKFEELTGRQVICNRPYSGTQLLIDFGCQHQKTGSLIVYTSTDSVFQIAAHEDVVPLAELYHVCEIARDLLRGDHSVGRVIARPFCGQHPEFVRTHNRRDFSLPPPRPTLLDLLKAANKEVIAVGKIGDIFANQGCTRLIKTRDNSEGMKRLFEFCEVNFEGLCFLNLVDFDMLYGHRRNVQGYAMALEEFDRALVRVINMLAQDDLLIITADHGCDPACQEHTDHTREYVPILVYGANVKPGINLQTRETFADVAATILDYFEIQNSLDGSSFWPLIKAY